MTPRHSLYSCRVPQWVTLDARTGGTLMQFYSISHSGWTNTILGQGPYRIGPDNNINLRGLGISMASCSLAVVGENTIRYNSTGPGAAIPTRGGIRIWGGEKNQLLLNNLYADLNEGVDANLRGIHTFLSNFNFYLCNTATEFGTGMNFDGYCPSAVLSNTMNAGMSGQIGLATLNGQPFGTGDQGSSGFASGNVWNGSFNLFQTRKNWSNLTPLTALRYYVRNIPGSGELPTSNGDIGFEIQYPVVNSSHWGPFTCPPISTPVQDKKSLPLHS